jgi:hypothetical protein
VLTLLGTAASALSQAPAKRFPITSGAIIAAMEQRQLPVNGVQVRLAAPITASVAEPALDIHSLMPGDKHSAQLLVGCRNSAECLPFYVSVSWPVEVDVATLHNSLVHETENGRDAAVRAVPAEASALRAGSPATLLLDGDRVHVTLRVVCLESAEPGEKVRVTTPDRRQQYVASVIAPGVLKGTF